MSALPSTAISPSSGSSAIVWPRLTFRPPIDASRTASVTTNVWMPWPASVISVALAAASRFGSIARSAAKPSAALRVGTTTTGRSVIEATWPAASSTFRLLGRTMISRASTLSITSSSSPVLGLSDWPPSTIAATPKSRKIAARPSPDTTATTPIAGGFRLPSAVRLSARPTAVATLPSPTAGEVGGLRLANVARLVVEVLDADPAQRPDRQAVPDHEVRSLVVDMDLERPSVARDQHRIRRSPRDGRGSRRGRATPSHSAAGGTSSRSRSPRRRGPRAWTPSPLPAGLLRATRHVPGRGRRGAGARPRTTGGGPHRPNRRRPASRRTSSSVGVDATDFCAASTVAAITFSMSSSRSAAVTAAAADSRMTVRIVPSTGLATAGRQSSRPPTARAQGRGR